MSHAVYKIPQQHELYRGKFLCRCAKCGWLSHFVPTVEEAVTIHGPCPKASSPVIAPPTVPGLLTRSKNFVKAYAQHLASGGSEASFTEILRRFTICAACPSAKFNDVLSQCAVCGCHVNLLLADEGFNKLAWTDSKCDLEHWAEIHR